MKVAQLVVAIATTLLLGAGWVPPDPVVGFLLVPFGVLYVFWAIRCLYDRRWSIWLACVSTLMVAIVMSALGGSMTYYALPSHRIHPAVVVDATGAAVALSPGALPALDYAQPQIDRRDQAQAAMLLVVAAGAWAVLGLYVFEWRWALMRSNGT